MPGTGFQSGSEMLLLVEDDDQVGAVAFEYDAVQVETENVPALETTRAHLRREATR